MYEKVKTFFQKIGRFLREDIWHIDTNGIGYIRATIYNIIKAFILTYRNFNWNNISTHASALTYNTLLSIVPLLAVLFAIAGGFGFQNIIQSELFNYFEGQRDLLAKGIEFIDKSLQYAQGGIFVGIGVILLFYTVLNLISSVEENFNSIWRIKSNRSYYRQFTDYMALILIAPVLIICNAGLTFILNSTLETSIIGVVVSPIIRLLPFFVTILLFTFLYIYIPNTRVKLSSALFAGIIAGICFQIFQQIYIGGQIWISKYNAIYGSFAALPLLLLWLQLSWLIVLVGVELSFSIQNITKFSFEKETKNVSRRYKDFIILLITALIVKRFEKGDKPYTANEISETYKIPTRLTNEMVYLLEKLNIIIRTPSDDDKIPAYIPAIDINKITVSYLFSKADINGQEDLKIENNGKLFKDTWHVITNIRKSMNEAGEDILVKDL